MSVVELKNSITEKLSAINDPGLLEEIMRLLKIETDDLDTYMLNEGQLSIVNEAQEQIKKGNFLTQDEADKEIEKYF